MRFHHPFGDDSLARDQSMKGFRSVVVGSAASGLLGAATFFVVNGLIPRSSEAWGQIPVPRMESEGGSADAVKDKLQEACLSGAFFEKGAFEQGACDQFRSITN